MGFWKYECLECRARIEEAKEGRSVEISGAMCRACCRDAVMQNERLFCRDCADRGETVVAQRIVGKTPVCDSHYRQRMGLPQLEKPVDRVIVKEDKQMAKFDREAVQKDRDAGELSIKDIAEKHGCSTAWIYMNTTAKNGASKPARKKKAGSDSSVDDVIADLKERRDKLTRAIEALEDV